MKINRMKWGMYFLVLYAGWMLYGLYWAIVNKIVLKVYPPLVTDYAISRISSGLEEATRQRSIMQFKAYCAILFCVCLYFSLGIVFKYIERYGEKGNEPSDAS